LDPRLGQYIALAIGKEKVGNDWRDKYAGYVTIHGVRALAQRTGMLDGQDGPYWCGTDSIWHDVWIADEAPAACKLTIYVKGQARGYTGTATMKQARTFVDRKDNNVEKLVPIWKQQPEIMLAVRAEMRALKMAGLIQDAEYLHRGIVGVAEAGELALISDERAERIRASKTVHAIAAGRSVDHAGVRAAAQHIDAQLESLADADVDTLAATADLIDVLDAEGVAVVTGKDASTVTGDEYRAAPEPAETGELITDEQIAYIERNWKATLPRDLTAIQQHILTGPAELLQSMTWREADDLVKRIAAALSRAQEQSAADTSTAPETPRDAPADTSDDVADDATTDFWKRARAAGFRTPADLRKAANLQKAPSDLQGLEIALKAAISNS
jgi:hypothetical protein